MHLGKKKKLDPLPYQNISNLEVDYRTKCRHKMIKCLEKGKKNPEYFSSYVLGKSFLETRKQ